MKAVLVMDMPRTCYECRIYQDGLDGYCPVGYLSPFDKYNKREDRCPLKPLPNRWIPQVNGLSTEQQIRNIDFASGWNSCLKKITGETE